MQIMASSDRAVNPIAVNEADGLVVYDFGYELRVLPIVEGAPTPDGLRIRCPFCGRGHHHGKGGGTRVAECDSRERRDYYVRPRGSTAPYAAWGHAEVEASGGRP